MQQLASRTLSSATLSHGAELVRGQSMSLEADEEYAALLAERERLLVTCAY